MSGGLYLGFTLSICILAVLPIVKCTDLAIDCSSTEQASTFTCLNIFFIAHVDIINALAASNDCDLTGINCNVFNTTVDCVNDLTLSENCRRSIRDYVDSVIATQEITCTVSDMEAVCPASPHILTIMAGGSATHPMWILLLSAIIVSLSLAKTDYT